MYNENIIEYESPSGSKKSLQHAVTDGFSQSDMVIIHLNNTTDINYAHRVVNGHISKHYNDTDKQIWLMNNENFIKYEKKK